MCATIEFCNKEKNYLLLSNEVFLGFKRFHIMNNKLYPYHIDGDYNFDINGFVVPNDKEQEISFAIAFYELNNNKPKHSILYKKFNEKIKLGYHISPIVTNLKQYTLRSTCLVEFYYSDIQFCDGNDIIVNKFKILDDNYEDIYNILIKIFGEKEIDDDKTYFREIINNSIKFNEIVKKQIKKNN